MENNYFKFNNKYGFINKEGNVQRFDDDGEPKGTGGIPMLEVLKKEEQKVAL